VRRGFAEQVDGGVVEVVRELPQGPRVPLRGDALGVERGELALELARHREVQARELAAGAVAQEGARLARVVVAVMTEIDDAAPTPRRQPPRRRDLGHENPPRKEAAGLLAERDDGLSAHVLPLPATGARDGRIACRARLSPMQAAQPMRLYQR